MKNYELTYLISPDLSEEGLESFQEKMNSLIKEEGGILNETGLPIKKRLGHPIKKKTSGYLGSLNFQLSSEKLGGFEKKLKSESNLLRYLILTKPQPKKIIARAKKLPPTKLPKRLIKPKPKVELTEIEEKLKEILGE